MKISFFNLNEIYYEKVSEKIKWFLKMFEPLSIIFIGVIIGLMQILCTYFGQGIKPIPLSMAIILSTIWLLKRWQHF